MRTFLKSLAGIVLAFVVMVGAGVAFDANENPGVFFVLVMSFVVLTLVLGFVGLRGLLRGGVARLRGEGETNPSGEKHHDYTGDNSPWAMPRIANDQPGYLAKTEAAYNKGNGEPTMHRWTGSRSLCGNIKETKMGDWFVVDRLAPNAYLCLRCEDSMRRSEERI